MAPATSLTIGSLLMKAYFSDAFANAPVEKQAPHQDIMNFSPF
nr:hypothetical protein [Chryseobacterium carnipullorum]